MCCEPVWTNVMSSVHVPVMETWARKHLGLVAVDILLSYSTNNPPNRIVVSVMWSPVWPSTAIWNHSHLLWGRLTGTLYLGSEKDESFWRLWAMYQRWSAVSRTCTDPEQQTLSEFRVTGDRSSVVKEQISDSLMYVCLKGNVCVRTVPLKGGN